MTKSTRSYKNFLGNFIYKNVKPNLFYGFIEKDWGDNAVYIATTAKAIFDYFYLRGLGNIKADVFDVRINWSEITGRDMDELEGYVRISKSQKMQSVFGVIKKEYVDF